VRLNFKNVEAKFAKDEEKSFYLHFPQFLVYFIPGLLLNPLQWEANKSKRRICVNGTKGPLGPNTPGLRNTHIPKPSKENPDGFPLVYYSTTLQ
jgi:hypothetical protein